VTTLDGTRVAVGPSDLAELGSRIEGRLLVDGDEGWDEAILVWNGMVAKRPALVVQPVTAADVAATVSFARERGLLLSVKGGGHHVAGISIAECGLTIIA